MISKLQSRLKKELNGAKRVALIGVGSDLRGDDAAGIRVAEELEKKVKSAAFKVFIGATAPENLTGEIKKFKPTHLIIVDAVNASLKPGAVFLLNSKDVGEGVSFSTHKMPVRVMIDYLNKSSGCESVIIGIQPKSVEFGKPLSKSVLSAMREASKTIASVVRGML